MEKTMAAELWLALQDGSRSCLERMKVASYLWKQEGVRRKKWALLMKWALDEVCKVYNRKAKRSRPPREVCEQLWQLLSVMLESIATSGVEIWPGETSPSVHFFQSACDVLNEVSAPDSDSSGTPSVYHVLKCLDSILAAPVLPPSLHKYDTVVLLLQSLLNLAVCSLKSHQTMEYPLSDIFQALEKMLRYFVYLQGSHGNPKKAFTSICNLLLPSVLRVKYHILTFSAVIQKADFVYHCELQIKNLISTLFNQEHLAEFTSAVVVATTVSTQTGSSQKRSATSYARVLFEALTKMALVAASASDGGDDSDELSEDYSAVVEALPDLYQCFLHQNRQKGTVSKTVEFKFLQKLVVLLDIEEKQLQSSPDSGAAVQSHSVGTMETDEDLDLEQILKHLLATEEDPDRSSTKQQRMIRVLTKCLELVWKYDIYQVAEDRDSGGEQFGALQRLSLKIIKGLNHSCVMESFDCLAVVMRLNHKLLEPWLPSLWFFMMVSHPTRIIDSLGQECVTIFAKLRQLPQLVTKLLEALDLLVDEITTISIPSSPIFASSTEQSFADCVSKLPPGQLAEIMELLLSYLSDKVTKLGSRVQLDSSLLPPLERAADISRLVLSHLPASFWSSKQKDRAVQLLRSLSRDVVLPLLTACTTHDFDARLSSVALLLSSEFTNLLAHLRHISPSLLPSQRRLRMVWNGELEIPIPEQWSGVFSIDKLNSLGRHLLRRMAILELRFHHDELPATPSQLLTFILSDLPAVSDSTSTTKSWNGQQLLDLVEENECVGYWSLLLSQLPFIYSHMTKEHLETVAKEMVKAILSGEGENGDHICQKFGVVDAIAVFLESEGFVEMRVLQELILNEFCTNLSSCLRRSLPKPLRKALKEAMSSSERLQESLTTSLCTVLRHGLGALRDHPPTTERAATMFDGLFNKINIPLVNQLVRNFPLGSLSQVSLLQSLLLFTVLHISAALLMYEEEYQEEVAGLLEELTYLLSWMIHSLAVVSVRERDAKLTRSSKRRKKRAEPSSSEGEVSSIQTAASELWSLFTFYTYEYMTLIQMLDVPASLLGSTLVAMEISVSGLVKLGDYPSELLEKVVGDLQQKPKNGPMSSSAAAENCLYIITNVSCKLLSVSSSKHQRDSAGSEEGKSHVSNLLEHTMAAIEKFLARKRKELKPSSTASYNTTPLEVVHDHPVLMSTLALLLHNIPHLISERHEEIVSLLCGLCEETYTPRLVEKPHAQFSLFCGIADVLSLPAVTSNGRLHKCSSVHGDEDADTESMEVTTGEEDSRVRSETLLFLSWKRLQSVLGCIFSEALQLKSSHSYELLHCLECSFSAAKSWSQLETGRRRVDMFSSMCEQLSRTMSTLLTAASNEELHLIMEQLLGIKEPYSVSSVLTFSFSWCVVVGNTKLPQEKRSLIRKYLQRILSVCQSISIQHSSDIFAVSLTIQLVARLVSIPASIGLDHTSVLLALELCTFASKLKAVASHFVTASLVVAETDLLLGVLRQHVSVATSAPSPIVASVNKLLGVVAKLGQAVNSTATATVSEVSDLPSADPGGPTLLEVCIHCATKLSRLMEVLSQKSSFTKLAVYIVHVFLTSSQGAILNQDVKKALLSGVFHLLKLCTPKDIAFIKASIDPATRDNFQTLIEEYQRYHKFGGRV